MKIGTLSTVISNSITKPPYEWCFVCVACIINQSFRSINSINKINIPVQYEYVHTASAEMLNEVYNTNTGHSIPEHAWLRCALVCSHTLARNTQSTKKHIQSGLSCHCHGWWWEERKAKKEKDHSGAFSIDYALETDSTYVPVRVETAWIEYWSQIIPPSTYAVGKGRLWRTVAAPAGSWFGPFNTWLLLGSLCTTGTVQ